MPSNVAIQIELIEAEREQLEAWSRRRTSSQALAQRSRIVLLAAEGFNSTEIAERLGTGRPMITKWRNRFAEHRWTDSSTIRGPGRRGMAVTKRLVTARRRTRSVSKGTAAGSEAIRRDDRFAASRRAD